MVFAVGLTILIAFMEGFVLWKTPGTIHFMVQGTNGVPSEVSIRPSTAGALMVTSKEPEGTSIIALDEFFEKYKPRPKIVPSPNRKKLLALGGAYVLPAWTLFFVCLRDWKRSEKMRTLLNMHGQTNV